jgi:hypothetical protein
MVQTYLAHCLAGAHLPSSHHPSLPAQAMIYDSLPSTVSFKVFNSFTTSGILSPSLRTAAKIILCPPAYAATMLYRSTIDRRPDAFTLLRADLDNPKLVPQHAPRTFIYSDVDDMTPMESVERYVDGVREQLRSEGLDADELVKLEKFVGSPHVSHAKMDPGRYWAAVVRTWEASYRVVVQAESVTLRCKL